MIQVLPAVQRGPKTSARIAQGLGTGLGEALKLYSEHQKQKQFGEALQGVEDIYGDENLSESQKLIAAYRKLGTHNPQMAQQLGGQLSRLGLQEEKIKNKKQETAAKLAGEEKTNKQLASFAERLESSNPDSPMHRTVADIYRTDLPLDQKTQLVKTLTGMDPFKMEQQRRLQMDSVLKRYNSRIKELQQSIRDARYNERAPLQQQLKDLQDERDDLLDFKALNGDPDEDVEDEEDFDFDDKAAKVQFDPNNKEHKAKAQQLFKKFKDKEKVRKELLKEFEGL